MQMNRHLKQLTSILLLLAFAAVFLLPGGAAAEAAATGEKLVRVGWFDSSFCYWDQFGRRCGIDYEYQQKISAYTGWTFEYVEDSWPNLLQKLMAGEIDLLSDVSYKPEREEFISYPDLPMGSEIYYIYISAGNDQILAEDLSTFTGKRIGVNKGSVQEGFLENWVRKNNVDIEIVPLTTDEDVSMNMVLRGTLDGYASIYSVGSEQRVFPLCRIGASEYYYGVTKDRPDLLAELNMALSGIRDEDPYFNERLSEKQTYLVNSTVSLSPAEERWLSEHETIRVGYVDNYLPFSETDRQTGELTGGLKDFLAHAANHLYSRNVRFETKAYASTAAALEALQAGECDCVFPVYLSDYDAELQGVFLTNPAMKTGINEVLHNEDTHTLSRDSSLSIAIAAGSVNVETFIKEQYPNCRILTFPEEKNCYEAVTSGTADCILLSNYRVPAAEETIKRHKLYSVPTGEHIPLSFAVRRADRDLYFILNKAVIVTPSGDMDSALASYMRTEQKVSFIRFIEDNWLIVLGFLTAVFAVILFLLLQRLKAQRKAHEQQQMLEEAAEIAELKQTITSLLDNMPGMNFTKDAKTGVYLACNQAFADYAGKKTPEEVIGQTDEELFDAETAKRLVEDDRMALSMDGPYTFFEDAPDEEGNLRQVRTTKQKYTDATGRLCVLGVLVDVTDSVHIHRNRVSSREDYEKAKAAGIVYTHIAQALARGYEDLYYIDLNTEQFIEYRTDAEGGLTEARRGWHFFEECQEEAEQFVYEEDREAVRKALDRKTLTDALDQNNSFMMTYRLIGEKGPTYVSMKVNRMTDDDRYIVLGVTSIDEQVRQRSASVRAQEERIAYRRLSALAGEYLCIYVVDPETSRYREFSSAESYGIFDQAKEGTDFFGTTREAARKFAHPEDLNRVLSVFTRENVLADIEHHGMFTLSYRLIMEGKPRYIQLKAAMVEEKDGRRLIAGINDIDAQVRQEEDYVSHLAKARIEANVDALTGVKNRHAFLMAEEKLNRQLEEEQVKEFAIVILDINDLKTVNDTQGHKAGDQHIREACRIICNTFKHCPVFRLGGDEFAVIAQGEDYAHMDELIRGMEERNEEALRNGGIVIACGMARRGEESSVAAVFEQADQQMYDNKNVLKNRQKG